MKNVASHREMAHSGRAQRGRRTLLTLTLIIGLTMTVSVRSLEGEVLANPGSSTVEGTIFQDFGSDGVMNTTVVSGQATDIGIAGVTVSAYNAVGALVGSALTTADGTYTIQVSEDPGTPLRIEFTTPDSGPLAALRPSFSGADNGTTVQFVEAGDTNVDAAFNVPGEYCQANPHLAVSRLCAGKGTVVDQSPTIFVTQYDGGPYDTTTALTNGFTSWTTNSAATKQQTGSILGMAWDPTTRLVYNTAYVRRHAELYEVNGVPRPGALFATTPNGSRSGDPTGGTTIFVADLESLIAGDQFSNSNSAGPGYIPTNAARRLDCIEDQPTATGCSDDHGVDSDIVAGSVGVFEEVGATGIGDIESDGKGNLYVVSLYNKHLYKVTLSADGLTATGMESMGNIASAVNCINGQARPFSVRLWRGSLYLGVVCDGSEDFNEADPFAVDNANLSFTILTRGLEPADSFTTFFGPQSLSSVVKGFTAGNGTQDPESLRWNAWTNYYPPKTSTSAMARFNQRPSPILSELEFDKDGSMILGFRDRTGDQTTTNGSETPSGGETTYPAISSGDLYRVCRVGDSWDGSAYKFEGTDPGCPQSTNQGFVGNGVEFYFGDAWSTAHAEISAGMLLQVPGFPDVIFSAFDPFTGDSNGVTTFYSGGIRYLSNTTGGPAGFPNGGNGVMFYSSSPPLNVGPAWFETGSQVGGFMKVNGMSDIEALCDQAPVQIGNRVWIDTNKNGIQDPDEDPVAGVTVRLYSADGQTLLGTAITNADGEYYFSSDVTEAVDGGANPDHIGGGVVIGEAHIVRFDEPADYAAGGPLEPYVLTGATEGTNTSIDSNATMVDGFPQISVPARSAGQNDHTFDVGFYLAADQQSLPSDGSSFGDGPIGESVITEQTIKVSVGDYVWWDTNEDGRQDETDIPLEGVVLRIYTVDGEPVVDVFGNPVVFTTTNAQGWYTFDNLPPGQYRVEIEAPEGFVPTLANVGSVDGDSSTGFAVSRILVEDEERDPTLDFGFVPASGAQLPAAGLSGTTYLQISLLVLLLGVLFGLFAFEGRAKLRLSRAERR
jgi:hypothetical protein